MRHQIWVAFVMLAGAAVMAAHPWYGAVGASPVVPGQSLADIPLGTPIAEVLARFGSPSGVALSGNGGVLGYGFPQYGITVYTRADAVVGVATTNSVLGSVNGIGLGMPLSAVVRAFGRVYSPGVIEGFPGVVYGGLGVGFGLDDQTVAAIMIFNATAAKPARPASPMLPAAPGQPASPALPAAPAEPTSPALPVAPITSSVGRGLPAAGSTQTVIPGLSEATTPPVSAAVNPAASPALPDVSGLKPYTAATHFLSLAGYLRYLVHHTSDTWITPQDSEYLMQQTGPQVP